MPYMLAGKKKQIKNFKKVMIANHYRGKASSALNYTVRCIEPECDQLGEGSEHMIDIGLDGGWLPGGPVRLGNHAGELAPDIWAPRQLGDATGPIIPAPLGDPWLGDVIDNETEVWECPCDLERSGQVGWADEQIIAKIAFDQFLEPVLDVGAEQPVNVRFVMDLMPNADQAGRGEQLVQGVAYPLVTEVHPAHHARNGFVASGER